MQVKTGLLAQSRLMLVFNLQNFVLIKLESEGYVSPNYLGVLGVILGIHINHDGLELAVYLVQDERQVAAQLMTLVMRYDHNAESRQL